MTLKADISRVGRPRRGENRLAEYADEAPHPGMRLLARKAVKRGRTLESLAAALGRDPRAVARTLLAKKPRVDSARDLVVEVMSELKNVGIIAARALLDASTAADERFARWLLDQVFQRRSHSEIYPEMVRLAPQVRTILDQAAPEPRREALCRFMVAEWGIDERDSIEVIAVALGITIPEAEAGSQQRRQYEAIAALLWLLKVLALERRTRLRVVQALEPTLRDFPILREILLENELDLDWADRDRLADAIAAARWAFLDAMGPLTEPRVPTSVTIDPAKLQYTRKEIKR